MEAFIKYKRFQENFSTPLEHQEFLDKLITEGWEIIYYDEKRVNLMLTVVMLCGKKQNKGI